MAASSPAVRARRRASARGRVWTRIGTFGAGGLAAILLILGLAFAGSKSRLADGTRIAGVDVGGLSPSAAEKLLRSRATSLEREPVTFSAAGKRFRLTPKELGVSVNWHAAVAVAKRQGGGFGFVRGYRRLELQLFPANITPRIRVYDAGVDYELGVLGQAVDRPHHEARLVRHGLHISIAAGAAGVTLDRAAARPTIVRSLASFVRKPVTLPVRRDPPSVTVASLTQVQELATRVVAAPVTVALGDTRWRLARWRLAKMLQLPTHGDTTLRLAGPAAEAYFAQLQRRVGRPPRDAGFEPVSGGGISIVPAEPGLALDVLASASQILAAAERPTNRVAHLVVAKAQPKRTTAEAKAMGINGTVGSFETIYGGVPNRIHNVQLVAHLIDGTLVAPGATFSFNATTGERTAAKGFLTAPVIINGELSTGLGGGVCQVSTTVFNAAYEAGLPITARTNHALYISHYPLGRDATVDYPGVDLKFVNDTSHWLLLRTFVGAYSLSVVLYGTPQHRRVVSETGPLTAVARAPVKKTVDPTLKPGEVVVDDPGQPAQTTWAHRTVYSPSGKLLSDATWYSSYRSSAKLVRVGPKKPKVKAPATAPEPPH